MTDSGKMRHPGAIFYSTNSKNKLPFLNHLIGVNEYEVDTSGIMNTDYGNGNKRSRIVIIQYIDFIIKQSINIDMSTSMLAQALIPLLREHLGGLRLH